MNAFTGADLEMLLRAREIKTIILFGIATSGCDADYILVVIADCCADLDAELHGALLNQLFPQRAEVLTTGEFVKALPRA